MTATSLIILTKFQQSSPNMPTALAVLGLLVLVILFAGLFSQRQSLRGASGKHVDQANHFPRQLAELAHGPLTPDALAQRLQSLLENSFQFKTVHLGQLAGHQLNYLLNIEAGKPKVIKRQRLSTADLPFSLEEIKKKPYLTWQNHDHHPPGRYIVFPLCIDQELTGFLLLGGGSDSGFEAIKLIMLQQITAVTATVTQLLALDSDLDERANQLMILGDISRRLISLRPLEKLWQDILPLLSQTFGFANVQIYKMEEGLPA